MADDTKPEIDSATNTAVNKDFTDGNKKLLEKTKVDNKFTVIHPVCVMVTFSEGG